MVRYKTSNELVINKLLKWWRTRDQRHNLLLRAEAEVWFMLQPHCCIFNQILQEMVKFRFPCACWHKLSPGQWGVTCPMGAGEEEGELSNPWGSGPPSEAFSIPPRPCQNPPDSSPHYLPISGLAQPPYRPAIEGFTVDLRRKNRETLKKIAIRFPYIRQLLWHVWNTRGCDYKGKIYHDDDKLGLSDISYIVSVNNEITLYTFSIVKRSILLHELFDNDSACTIMPDQSQQFASY